MAESVKKVLYTGIFLDQESRQLLLWYLKAIMGQLPIGIKTYGDHMTLCLGEFPSENIFLQPNFIMICDAIGWVEGVLAVRVKNHNRPDNVTPHITIFVDVAGGKTPAMANNITIWNPLPSGVLILKGTVKEVTQNGKA